MDKEEKKTEDTSVSPSQNIYIWIVAAILLLIGGWFGWNMLFGGGGEYTVTLVDAPKVATIGAATFTWRVDGPPAVIPNTEVYFGQVSNPGELGKDVLPSDTKYTDFVKDFADGKYNVPLQFVGNTAGMTTAGTYYFRVHATINKNNYWTDEYTLEVKKPDYSVSLLNYPKDVTVKTLAAFTWRVDGPQATTINHTSIHFGTESSPGELGKEVKPADTTYTDLVKDFVEGKYNIPLQFVGNVKFTKLGTYYLRAHAIVNDQNFWTQEYSLEVNAASPSAKSPTLEPIQ